MAASIRQRNRAEQSPSSRGSLGGSSFRSDSDKEMTRIVIEEDGDDDMMFDSYYTAPQPPVFIPDKHYKDFMLGRTSKIKQRRYPTGKECASHCISFSWVGVAFLVRSNRLSSMSFFGQCMHRLHLYSFFHNSSGQVC